MYRKFGLGVAAILAIGLSLSMVPSANAFHGGSNGSHGGFFGGSHGSRGGSFGGLFKRHHGSSGSYGSHGGSSNGCACDCNGSEEEYGSHDDGNNEDRNHVSNRGDDRSIDAPSREVRHESNSVIVNERERDNRGHESARVDSDHRNDKNLDRDRDDDKKGKNNDKDTKKDESKVKDKGNEKNDDSKK